MELEKEAMVVLIQTVEEVLPEHIPPETHLEAHLNSANSAEGTFWAIRCFNF